MGAPPTAPHASFAAVFSGPLESRKAEQIYVHVNTRRRIVRPLRAGSLGGRAGLCILFSTPFPFPMASPSQTAAPATAEDTDTTDDPDVTAGLNRLLASATVFYQKARHYHWNVTGPHFFTLHEEFEELYEFWTGAIDELAERVRSRGDRPVHTLADMVDLSSIEEDASTPEAPEMVRVVTADLGALDEQAGRLQEQADAAGDSGTEAVLGDLREQIEADRWMLRAWLDQR